LVSARTRDRARRALGIAALQQRLDRLETDLTKRLDRLETQLLESREDGWDRSRRRWWAAKPDANLTWGARPTGDAFVSKAVDYGAFGPGRTVLEIGPGYGRLLSACLERGVEFSSYVGVDLSEDNVAHLRERFQKETVRFICADVETVDLEEGVDSVLSSLTFKHLFPSFEAGLTNLARQLRPGGTVLFDLIEGQRRYFEEDGVTYIRWYSRPEVEEILGRAGLEPVAFDEVRHLPELTRLLVVARKPAPA
jgi:SAM-dependent methyltransferase